MLHLRSIKLDNKMDKLEFEKLNINELEGKMKNRKIVF
jgi:hypothetical protein